MSVIKGLKIIFSNRVQRDVTDSGGCICVSTIELAGVRLQTVKQILVPTRSSSVDGQDEPSGEGGVPVAQLGQLHRQ